MNFIETLLDYNLKLSHFYHRPFPITKSQFPINRAYLYLVYISRPRLLVYYIVIHTVYVVKSYFSYPPRRLCFHRFSQNSVERWHIMHMGSGINTIIFWWWNPR